MPGEVAQRFDVLKVVRSEQGPHRIALLATMLDQQCTTGF
jgi:hypothetical protein